MPYQHEDSPALYGLVLSGGKSIRMGINKGLIDYNGIGQAEYIAELLSKVCSKTFLSTSDSDHKSNGFSSISDLYPDKGPLGGIISAFEYDNNVAWLTIPCDLPFLNADTIQFLIESRNANKEATCFINDQSQSLHPLVTIWEPRIYKELKKQFLSGQLSPRRLLLNSDVQYVKQHEFIDLTDCNTPDQRDEALKRFQKGSL